MLAFFRALTDRLKALFMTDAALDLEAHVLTRAAERKADLLRPAAAFEAEGLTLVAAELRQQAGAIDLSRPLASVLPAIGHLTIDTPTASRLSRPIEATNGSNGHAPSLPEPTISPRKTNRKSRCMSR
jgi:hypothetical protein